MAFTRKFLSSLGIEEDKVDTIIDAHAEVVDALKDEVKQYKEDAEKLPEVQKQLDDALKVSEDGYEDKYNDLKKEYEDYKAKIAEDKAKEQKAKAYRDILMDIGVADKRLDTVLKVDGDVISGIEFDENGNIKDVNDIKAKAREEWADFIVTEETHGSNPAQPPTNTGGKMSKEDIMKIKDTAERQKAIADNHEVFGF